MSKEIRELEPKAVWNHFADLNAVPRPSKKEERVRKFIKDFGSKHDLEIREDEIGNIVLAKSATKGMENRKKVVLQSHLDMVHQKNDGTDFDFEKQGIEMYVEDGFVKAKGTTLGADNGMGVAAIMAVLSSEDLEHPAIEGLFTVDEETGMTGAKQLDPHLLEGEILLNLDTEEDDELDVGCAGGVDITATKSVNMVQANGQHISVVVSGLQGGHSGMDIIKGLGNANKFLGRLLFSALQNSKNIYLSEITGGTLRNAIPREAGAGFYVDDEDLGTVMTALENVKNQIHDEFKTLEPNLNISIHKEDNSGQVMSSMDSAQAILTLNALDNGVYRMSPDIDGLVETSNNVAMIEFKDQQMSFMCLTRSSVDSNKLAQATDIESVFLLAGYDVVMDGHYPGWQPNMESPILQVARSKYAELFDHEPKVIACHAGLECGLIGQRYPNLDMVSFGPNIRGAHSPDERVEIKSVQKFWGFLQEILKEIPIK